MGFDALLSAKYRFALEGENDFGVVDAKSGEPIKNSKGTGFLRPKEVIELEAINAKLRKMNNAEGGQQKGHYVWQRTAVGERVLHRRRELYRDLLGHQRRQSLTRSDRSETSIAPNG